MKLPHFLNKRLAGSHGSIKADFIRFLKENNCKYEIDVDDDDKSSHIHFIYQGGQFVATIKSSDMGVDVTYPGFGEVPAAYGQIVRALCNHMTANNTLFKFVYTYDEDEHRFDLHLSFFNNAVIDEQLTGELQAVFYFQRQFMDELHNAINTARETDTDDIEQAHDEHARERAMLRELEMKHLGVYNGEKEVTIPSISHTVGEILSHALGNDLTFTHLLITTGTRTSWFTDHAVIADYDLMGELIEGKDADSAVKEHHLVASVGFYHSDVSARVLTATLSMDMEDDAADAIYVRLNILLPPPPRNRAASLCTPAAAHSMLLVHNKRTPRQLEQEAEYMFREVQIRSQKNQSLTDDQLYLLSAIDNNVLAYNLYWGRRHLLAKCFYSAAIHLENAFRHMNYEKSVYTLDKAQQHNYNELCHDLGLCYLEMQQYDRAHFLLSQVGNVGNVRFTKAYLELLVQSHDSRTIEFVDEIIQTLEKNYNVNDRHDDDDDDDDDMPPMILDFYHYVRRCRVRALIQVNKYKEAIDALMNMVHEPENTDFAIENLALAKKLQEEEPQLPF